MKRVPMGVLWRVLAAAVVAMGLGVGGPAMAAGYWVDAAGHYVRDVSGDCVRTGSWTPADANAQCDPQLAAFEAPAPTQYMRRVNLNADTQFAFDKAVLTPSGKAQLDQIVTSLNKVRNPQVQINGYTDRIGTEAYNQRLSLRRAEAVRAYLVSQGVPADAITVTGKGESDPLVACAGQRGQALIDCLAPNRRSQVEFSAFEVTDQPPGTPIPPQESPAPEGTMPGR